MVGHRYYKNLDFSKPVATHGINDCVYYDAYLEISWKQVVEDIQSIADEYGAEIVSIERYN